MAEYSIVTTVRLDPEYKELFEKLSDLHNMTITDACRLGMEEILKPYLPAYHLYKEIELHETTAAKLRDALPLAEKVDKDSLSSHTKSTTPIVDSIFLEQREQLFKDKPFLTLLQKGREPSWDRFYFKCGFESPGEAKKWFLSEAMKRGLVK